MTLHFTGPLRTAALAILYDTPLGDTLARLEPFKDNGGTLTVPEIDTFRLGLSRGEAILYDVLDSLDSGALWDAALRLDEDCKVALLHALAAAFGIEVAVEGGVRYTPGEASLLYVTGLRNGTSNPDVLRVVGLIEHEIRLGVAQGANTQNSSGRAGGASPSTKRSDVVSGVHSCARPEALVVEPDALAKALCASRDITSPDHEAQDVPCGPCYRDAEHLMVAGILQTPTQFTAALANDEASVEVVASGMVASPSHATREQARRGLRALAERSAS